MYDHGDYYYDMNGGAKYSGWTYFLHERKLSPGEGSPLWAAMSPAQKEDYKRKAAEHSDGITTSKPRKPKAERDPQMVRRGKLGAQTLKNKRKTAEQQMMAYAASVPLPQQTQQQRQFFARF